MLYYLNEETKAIVEYIFILTQKILHDLHLPY